MLLSQQEAQGIALFLNTRAVHDVNPLILSQQVAIPSSLSETDTSHLLLLRVQTQLPKTLPVLPLFVCQTPAPSVLYLSVCQLQQLEDVRLQTSVCSAISALIPPSCSDVPTGGQDMMLCVCLRSVFYSSCALFLPQGYFNSFNTCIYCHFSALKTLISRLN